jgi:FAD/FMN-containing dehydrogenase
VITPPTKNQYSPPLDNSIEIPSEREWVRSMWNDLKPYMMGTGSYVNALEGQETDRVRETYGVKYERLTAIKAKYDPQNLFHRNVNIKPA